LTFQLVRVASMVGNLHSKFGNTRKHFGNTRPLGSWIIFYVCDRRKDGTRCVSALMGPVTFDLETGMRITSKVGNLPSKFGHARPLGSWIIRYVCDGQTDRWTKAMLIAPFPMVGGIIINHSVSDVIFQCLLVCIMLQIPSLAKV